MITWNSCGTTRDLKGKYFMDGTPHYWLFTQIFWLILVFQLPTQLWMFFLICYLYGIKLSLGQWCLEAAIQHFRLGGSSERVWNLSTCAVMKSGEHDLSIFTEFFLPGFPLDFCLMLLGWLSLIHITECVVKVTVILTFGPQRLLSSRSLFLKNYSLKISHEKWIIIRYNFAFYITFCPVLYSEII